MLTNASSQSAITSRCCATSCQQVFILITEDTIEEKLLGTLSAKHQLALGALDSESGVDQVALTSGIEELRRRLEVLLGARPDAPLDESLRREREIAAIRS